MLSVMYASRVVVIALYLLAPKTAMMFYVFYVFAAALGFTWLATVPPTAGLVGKLFGTRYLATLFGLTLLSHRGLFRCLSRRPGICTQRQLQLDVVRRYGAGPCCGAGEPANS